MYLVVGAFAICAFLAVGLLILWANPSRSINRLVAGCSIHIAAWQAFQLTAVLVEEGVFWYRCTVALGALFPAHLWLVKEALIGRPKLRGGSDWVRLVFWLLVPASLAAICFTDYFIPAHSTSDNRLYGIAFYLYVPSLIILYAFLAVETYLASRAMSGVERVELHLWLGGGIGAGGAVVFLMAVGMFVQAPWMLVLRPLILLSFFGAAAFAITAGRLFEAKYLLSVAIHRLLQGLLVAAVAYVVYQSVNSVLPSAVAFFVGITLALTVRAPFEHLLDRYMNRYPRGSEARAKALGVATKHADLASLEREFCSIASGWALSERAMVLSAQGGI
jgi:hypothetical protein